jgi:hypothetical protein
VTRRRIELLLWVLAGAAASFGWVRWRRTDLRASAPRSAVFAAAPAVAGPPPADAMREAVQVITANDVFRLDRSPAPLAFSTQPGGFAGGMPPPPPPPRFRPPLAVSGIVGPPWQAFLEGVPERGGSVVVQRGDTLAGLRVRSIGPDLVVVQGADTTWRLTPRKPWQ